MKKILLIEDVIARQEKFMSLTNFNLESYNDILENKINDKYTVVSTNLKNDSYDFDKYDIIISHQSAFEEQSGVIISKLKKYCEETKKPLVIFSGCESNYYNNTKHEYIQLNSKDFYSQNLKLFLDNYKDGNINLLMLSYGENWRVLISLNILEKINYFLGDQEKNFDDDGFTICTDFANSTKLNQLNDTNDIFYEMQVDEDDWVHKSEIIKFRDSLEESIKDAADA